MTEVSHVISRRRVLVSQVMCPGQTYSVTLSKPLFSPLRSPHAISSREVTSIGHSESLPNIKEHLDIVSQKPELQIEKNSQPGNWFVKKSRFSQITSILIVIALILTSFTLFALFVAPVAYYQLFSQDPVPVKASTEGTPLGGSFANGAVKEPQRRVPLPVYNENLPEGNWLIIPRIGVNTPILESAEPEESLKNGVWRVPDFGNPGDEDKPMILAAHRFGYKWWWQSQYWRYHSFYLLPELEPGDRIEVISGKRKYVYEIYAGEEGEDISDYYADLILYTCKYLNSPLRHFRYARLIDPNTNTQSAK